MNRALVFFCVLTMFLATAENSFSQNSRQRISPSHSISNSAGCLFTGVYRIDILESDKLYSVVKGATGKVPFGEQQKFFMDLSVRLTPPDILALECRGNRVSVGSSRAPRVTFVADGKMRRERNSDGDFINSRIVLENDALTFTSNGKTEDNVSVSFKSIENGQRLRVTRHIYAEQLTEPIVIQTIYNKISPEVSWRDYEDAQIARRSDEQKTETTPTVAERKSVSDAGNDDAARLREALSVWINATNSFDIEKQMSFYMPELKAYYLARNVSNDAVRREKKRVFSSAKSVDISAEEPEIIFQESGQTAIMRFRKKYKVADNAKTRSGEVIQELRWQKAQNGWRIFSERDIKVIR